MQGTEAVVGVGVVVERVEMMEGQEQRSDGCRKHPCLCEESGVYGGDGMEVGDVEGRTGQLNYRLLVGTCINLMLSRIALRMRGDAVGRLQTSLPRVAHALVAGMSVGTKTARHVCTWYIKGDLRSPVA